VSTLLLSARVVLLAAMVAAVVGYWWIALTDHE
jgi:hypothetical protein